jgi:DNA-binding MarR family transcriptional regulator
MKEVCGSAAIQIVVALHTLEARLDAALEPLGLSLAKLGALSKLAEAGEPLSLGTLAERCACVRSNITQLVDRLEADKLVARVDDARDRRSILAELTPKGRARHAAGLRALVEAEREVLGGLSRQRQDELCALLRSLAAGA